MPGFVTQLYSVFVCVGIVAFANGYGKQDPLFRFKLNIIAFKVDSSYNVCISGKGLIFMTVGVCLFGSSVRKKAINKNFR